VVRFHKFALAVGADRPVYGIRLPMDGNNQTDMTSVEDMASLYLREIRAIQPQGPYLLGGYMFGGLVAFEMAHRLMAQGEKIACLALIGTYAPGKTDPPTPGLWLRRHLESFQSLAPRERPAYLIRRVCNLPQVLAKRLRLNPSIWRDYQSNLRPPPDRLRTPRYVCDISARKYQPPALDHCNTVVYTCKLEATAPINPYRGWRNLVADGLCFSSLSATPFMATKEPGVWELAQKLRQDFDATDRR
jgi:thioesterase domain-containing protein